MIVVATEDFRFYHAAVSELRERGITFTTIVPGEEYPEETSVVLSTQSDPVVAIPPDASHVTTTAPAIEAGVEEALGLLRNGDGRIVVGVDPGERPGIAVLTGDQIVAAFHVPLTEAVETIQHEIADARDPIVRVGDGDRLRSARLVNDLDAATVELVDETGTTPSLGTGTKRMGDVLAAVNIARREGDRIERRDVDPTPGELQRIKDESREQSDGDRTIDEELARRVAQGDLTVPQALEKHRNDRG